MSTHRQPTLNDEPGGLELFFAMATAFMLVLATILVAFFLPVAIGVGLVFATLAIVLAAFGAYMARVLGS